MAATGEKFVVQEHDDGVAHSLASAGAAGDRERHSRTGMRSPCEARSLGSSKRWEKGAAP